MEGLARLGATRDALEAVLQGHWVPDPELLDAIADLLEAGALRLKAVA